MAEGKYFSNADFNYIMHCEPELEQRHSRCAVLGLGDVGDVSEGTEHEDGLTAREILERLEHDVLRSEALQNQKISNTVLYVVLGFK